MPRWRVYVDRTVSSYAEVTAETQEEAEDMVLCGEYADLYGDDETDFQVTGSKVIDDDDEEE